MYATIPGLEEFSYLRLDDEKPASEEGLGWEGSSMRKE